MTIEITTLIKAVSLFVAISYSISFLIAYSKVFVFKRRDLKKLDSILFAIFWVIYYYLINIL